MCRCSLGREDQRDGAWLLKQKEWEHLVFSYRAAHTQLMDDHTCCSGEHPCSLGAHSLSHSHPSKTRSREKTSQI